MPQEPAAQADSCDVSAAAAIVQTAPKCKLPPPCCIPMIHSTYCVMVASYTGGIQIQNRVAVSSVSAGSDHRRLETEVKETGCIPQMPGLTRDALELYVGMNQSE